MANQTLAKLTATVQATLANQALLESEFCPRIQCETDPAQPIEISTIGGVVFVFCVGLCVGTDVTLDQLRLVLHSSKRGFVVGMFCQFGFMPLFAFSLSYIFEGALKEQAFYSYAATVMGLSVIGCLPGGNTSNLFTWFCGGNVPLSILMSLTSNIAALGLMPLMLYLLYEQRFGDQAPPVPYKEIVVPLVITLAGVGLGMLSRARAPPETTWWVAKLSSLFGLFFLFAAVVIGLKTYPHILGAGWATLLCSALMQPVGYLFGFCFSRLAGCNLKDQMTIAFETGVQSFTLGLVIATLGFNVEIEACQFAPKCIALLRDFGVDEYEFSWSADGRVTEGDGKGKVSLQGFLPGLAGSRTTPGCCRFNELIFSDVFKFSAICSIMYVFHAFWLVKVFRKLFPRGFARVTEVVSEETWGENFGRDIHTSADSIMVPAEAPHGFGTLAATPALTVTSLIERAAARCGNEYALAEEWPCPPCPTDVREKMKGTESLPLKKWNKWTWKQVLIDSHCAANGFVKLGLEEYGSVCIFGFNSPQWLLSAMGAMFAGAKFTGIYPTDTTDHVVYKIRHCGAAVVVCEDNKKLKTFQSRIVELTRLKAVVMYREVPQVPVEGLGVAAHTWDQLQTMGAAIPYTPCKINPGQACALVYTSGTTGYPKAVMLSHDNLCFQAQATHHLNRTSVGVGYVQERMLSYLPLSHIAGLLVDLLLPIQITAMTESFSTVYFARPYDLKEGTLKNRMTFVRPTMFMGVPRVWEKMNEGLVAQGKKLEALKGLRARMPILCCFRKASVARWAKRQGLASAANMQFGPQFSRKTSTFFGLAEGMVLSKIHAALGLDAVKQCITGAAPMSKELLEYFGSIGLIVNECYGMSESTGVTTTSTPHRYLWGSCGFAYPGIQVRCFDDAGNECQRSEDIFHPKPGEEGEINFRGRHIMMGYLANPDLGEVHVEEIQAMTRAAIDPHGWLRSGDAGVIGVNGMVRITGRFKELIITAGGENVAPVPMEEKIKKLCPAISNVMMIGDRQKYNSCLITLKVEGATGEKPGGNMLTGPALELDYGVTTVSEAMVSKVIRALIEQVIKDTNNNSEVCPSNASRIQKFEILPTDFSVEGGELTPTLKLKRKEVEKRFSQFIEKIYTGKPEKPTIAISTAAISEAFPSVDLSIKNESAPSPLASEASNRAALDAVRSTWSLGESTQSPTAGALALGDCTPPMPAPPMQPHPSTPTPLPPAGPTPMTLGQASWDRPEVEDPCSPGVRPYSPPNSETFSPNRRTGKEEKEPLSQSKPRKKKKESKSPTKLNL